MHLSSAAGAEEQDSCEQVLVTHLGLPMREDRQRGVTWVRLDGGDAVEGVRADKMGSSHCQQAGAKEGASSKMSGPQQLHSRVPGQSTGMKGGAVCGRALASDAGTPGSSHDVDKLWQPFTDFLRERRQKAPLELAREACLPLRLLQQLQEYLPDDPAELLDVRTLHEQQLSPAGTGNQASEADGAFQSAGSLSSAQDSIYAGASCLRHAQDLASASAPPPLPALLHGDLIGQNILIMDHLAQHGSSDCAAVMGATSLGVNLIDFGDAGHGDPQYDLVLLFLSGFRCVSLQICLAHVCLPQPLAQAASDAIDDEGFPCQPLYQTNATLVVRNGTQANMLGSFLLLQVQAACVEGLLVSVLG
jgi:hypothetical protein